MTKDLSSRANRRFGWLLAILMVAVPGIAEAADNMADLKGLSQAALGASQLTADGQHCGLDLERITGTARRALSDVGFAVRDDAENRLTISAVTTRVGSDQCATAVMLGVYAKESFFSSITGWVQSGYVVLWQRSLMIATPVGAHASAVLDATRRLSEQMVTDWRAQNSASPAVGSHPEGRQMAGQPEAAKTK